MIRQNESNFRNPKATPCRVFQFSNSGQYFCYCDSVRTVLVESTTGKEILNVELPRTQQILFSPKDRLMATFEPYAVYGGTHLTTLIAQKHVILNAHFISESFFHLFSLISIFECRNSWKIQWTDDEVYSIRLCGSEILVHKYNAFGELEVIITQI
ncbi:unnamed protein product [Anisakis simplex]|uniref:Uncharacterized protein n=1 Tax=Anisakis simplex TaxID=6269 RepID=A0A3P6NAV1_ANISI|nr:unnamed protein product [Anisakis simplex]